MSRTPMFLPILVLACGAAPQLQVMGQEDPRTSNGGVVEHAHNDNSIDLPDDESVTEPDHPAVQTPQERAMTHVHTPKDICSGMLVGPKLVLTAHQCVGNDVKGAVVNTDDRYRVEVATTTLTWAARKVTHVLTPACDWLDFDAALLVLDAITPGTAPFSIASAAAPGATVQGLGFGRCHGETRSFGQRNGQLVTREPDAVSIDFGMCQGDVGGAVVDAGGGLIGIVSHQDDPDGATTHTTTAFRADAPEVRALMAAAEQLAGGTDPAKLQPIACH